MSEDVTLRIDLRAEVTVQDILAAAGRFFRWWSSEVIALMPAAWRRAAEGLFRTPRLAICDNTWLLANWGGEDIELDASQPAYQLRDELQRKVPIAIRNRVAVIVPQTSVLVRRVMLPAAAGKRLRSVVMLQLDRLSPFRGDDVLFDCRILETAQAGAGSDGPEIVVEVGIIPKRKLVAIEQQLREAGIVPRCFEVADYPFSFGVAGLPWTRAQQSQIVLAVLTAAVWMLAVWLAPSMQQAEISHLTGRIEGLAPETQRAQAVRGELAHYQLPPQALSGRRSPGLDVLAELNALLPDRVHITELELSDGRLIVQGTAPHGTEIGKAIRPSKLLTRVRVVPSSSPDGGFRIQAEVAPTRETQ